MPERQTQFHYPHKLAVDQTSHIYIADQRIRKINPQTGIDDHNQHRPMRIW